MNASARPIGGWSDADTNGWNAGERSIGTVRRIPLQGLTLVNQDPANDPKTREAANGRAIVCLPSGLDPAKPVDVLFHFHSANIGFRQVNGPGLFDAGTVRDVRVDKIQDQIDRSKRMMVGVLIQGSLEPQFGRAGTTGFDVNTVLDEVFAAAAAAGVWPSAPAIARVVLSAHGAGGKTVAALVGQPGQPRLPRAMGGLFLFAGIRDADELESVTRYIADRLNYDLLNIENLDPSVPDQLLYLQNSMQMRGFYNPQDSGSAPYHAALAQSIRAWFARNASAIGGTGSLPFKALAANYEITPMQAFVTDSLVGNTLLQALNDLRRPLKG